MVSDIERLSRLFSGKSAVIRSSKLPGFGWIVLGLTIVLLTAMRKVFYYWGVPLPQRLISQLGGTVGALTIVWGIQIFTRRMQTRRLIKGMSLLKVSLWRLVLITLFGFGLLRGNDWATAGKELIILWLFGEFLLVGADDHFWQAIDKPLTVMFYLGAPLVFMYYTTGGIITDTESTSQSELTYLSNRYLGTLGSDLRPLLASGLFLGVWGVLRPHSDLRWRTAQIVAFVVQFIATVALFKFRGGAITFAVTILSVLVIRPIVEERRRPASNAVLVGVCIVGLLAFAQTDAYMILMNRMFESTKYEPVFQSRLNELSAYWADVHWEILIGRGLGGEFDAFSALGTEASHNWRTIHFGIVVFTLKGGVFLFLLFLSFVWPGFLLRPKAWYQNPCNLTAALLFPTLLFQFVMNPFALVPDSVFNYLPAMMVLSRFGRRAEVDIPSQSQFALFAGSASGCLLSGSGSLSCRSSSSS